MWQIQSFLDSLVNGFRVVGCLSLQPWFSHVAPSNLFFFFSFLGLIFFVQFCCWKSWSSKCSGGIIFFFYLTRLFALLVALLTSVSVLKHWSKRCTTPCVFKLQVHFRFWCVKTNTVVFSFKTRNFMHLFHFSCNRLKLYQDKFNSYAIR